MHQRVDRGKLRRAPESSSWWMKGTGCYDRAMLARVYAVSLSPSHSFSKQSRGSITLLEGLGVEGDAHCGATVKHRSRVKQDPTQPNLRQVHLVHRELFDELAAKGL